VAGSPMGDKVGGRGKLFRIVLRNAVGFVVVARLVVHSYFVFYAVLCAPGKYFLTCLIHRRPGGSGSERRIGRLGMPTRKRLCHTARVVAEDG